jgi:predicted DNA-binding transcriptional regulator
LSDRGLGALIILFSLIVMFGYFVWAFAPILSMTALISQAVSDWAFKLPVILAVYAILVIALWIGYTMATTPPPMPLEKPLELEREEASGVKEEGDEGKEETKKEK